MGFAPNRARARDHDLIAAVWLPRPERERRRCGVRADGAPCGSRDNRCHVARLAAVGHRLRAQGARRGRGRSARRRPTRRVPSQMDSRIRSASEDARAAGQGPLRTTRTTAPAAPAQRPARRAACASGGAPRARARGGARTGLWCGSGAAGRRVGRGGVGRPSAHVDARGHAGERRRFDPSLDCVSDCISDCDPIACRRAPPI